MRRTFESQTYTIVAYITLTMCFLRSQENLDNNIHIYYNAHFKSQERLPILLH